MEIGDRVKLNTKSNEKYVISNDRNNCLFEVIEIGDTTSKLLGIDSNKNVIDAIKGKMFDIENICIKSNEMLKLKQIVICNEYPNTSFEVVDMDDDEVALMYYSGVFEEHMVNEIWLLASDVYGSDVGNSYNENVPNRYVDEIEEQCRQIEKEHLKAKSNSKEKVFTRQQSMTASQAVEIVDSLKDDTGSLVAKYLDELGVRRNNTKPIGRYSQKNLRLLNNILD